MHPINAKIATIMADGRERTTAEIAERVGTSKQNATRHLRKFEAMGLLVSAQLDYETFGWRKA